MIGNERQYKISKSALAEVNAAIEKFDIEKVAAAMGSKEIAKTQLQALESERENLTSQLQEYDALKSGVVSHLKVAHLGDLPRLLVRARIAKGWSQKDLAAALDLKEQQIQRYESEEYASASFRRLMEIARALGLEVTESLRVSTPKAQPENLRSTEDLDWSKFPFREMYKRAWFEGFDGSISDAESVSTALLKTFLGNCWKQPYQAFHRKHERVDFGTDEYSLIAWECRILKLASQTTRKGRYKKTALTTDWFSKLVKLSAKKDGPLLARSYLADANISLVLEPHLPRTYLDGAMLASVEDRPVIGMTLRYDRLDNFWFVLLHELGHLILHFDEKKPVRFFDNLEVRGDTIEQEADHFACETLLPEGVWQKSVARYVRTPESVNQLAKKLEIGSWIVAGRIRKESENYTLLRDLVGAGEVRKEFPEVRFGY